MSDLMFVGVLLGYSVLFLSGYMLGRSSGRLAETKRRAELHRRTGGVK